MRRRSIASAKTSSTPGPIGRPPRSWRKRQADGLVTSCRTLWADFSRRISPDPANASPSTPACGTSNPALWRKRASSLLLMAKQRMTNPGKSAPKSSSSSCRKLPFYRRPGGISIAQIASANIGVWSFHAARSQAEGQDLDVPDDHAVAAIARRHARARYLRQPRSAPSSSIAVKSRDQRTARAVMVSIAAATSATTATHSQ